MKRTSAELKRLAREHLQGHYGLAIGTLVVAMLISYVATMIPTFLLQFMTVILYFSGAALIPIGIILVLITIAISLVLTVLVSGLFRIHLKFSRGESASFSDLFYCFTIKPHRFILAGLLLIAISFCCILPGLIANIAIIFVGTYSSMVVIPIVLSVLLYIAGTVFMVIIELNFSLVTYLLIDNPNMGVMEAFRTSNNLMKGNKGRLFYIALSFIGWIFLGALSCYIGLLWIMPYMYQTIIEFYRDVTGELK